MNPSNFTKNNKALLFVILSFITYLLFIDFVQSVAGITGLDDMLRDNELFVVFVFIGILFLSSHKIKVNKIIDNFLSVTLYVFFIYLLGELYRRSVFLAIVASFLLIFWVIAIKILGYRKKHYINAKDSAILLYDKLYHYLYTLYDEIYPQKPTINHIKKWEAKLQKTSKDRFIYNFILMHLSDLYLNVDEGFNSKYLQKSIEYRLLIIENLPPIPLFEPIFGPSQDEENFDNIDFLILIETYCLQKIKLSVAFRNLFVGNRRENLNKSLGHLADCFRYRKYLQKSTHIRFLWEYAKTNTFLAEMGMDEDLYFASAFMAYSEIEYMMDRNTPYDIIEILKKKDRFKIVTLLLQLFLENSLIEEGAQIYIGIGNAYFQKWNQTNDESSMKKSLEFYKMANDLLDGNEINTQTLPLVNQLIGDVYTKTKQYETALFYYRKGVTSISPVESSRQRALLLFKIGEVYFLKFKKDHNLEFVKKSVIALSKARKYIDYEIDPFLMIQILELLADSYFEIKDWDNAYYVLEEAVHVSNMIYKIYFFNEDKATFSTKISRIFHKYALSASKLGLVGNAISVLEAGKNRLVNESLISQTNRPDNVPEALWQEFVEITALLRASWLEGSKNDSIELYKMIKNNTDRFRHLLHKINKLVPNFMEDENIIKELTNFDFGKTILINAAVTDYGSVVFIIRSSDGILELYHEELPDLTERQLTDILKKYAKIVHDRFSDKLAYNRDFERDLSIFDVLSELSEIFLYPIIKYFTNNVDNIVFIQSYGLSVFPLHLLFTSDSGDDEVKMLIDDFIVTFSPSIKQFVISKNKAESFTKREHTLLAVVNPSGTNLKFAPLETEFISRFIPNENVRILKQDNARKSIFFECASQFSLWHFACHSLYDWNKPLNSYLLLADGERLTLIDLLYSFNDISHTRLVTLSTCESGLVDFLKWQNEYIGLPLGFLQVGIPAVISSLWEVDDKATSLLMIKFYRNVLIGDMEISEALRNAQLWLRDLDVPDSLISQSEHSRNQSNSRKAYSNPRFWAPFILTGY